MARSILLLAVPALCFVMAESMFFPRRGFRPLPLKGIAPLPVPIPMGIRPPMMKRGPIMRRGGPIVVGGGRGGRVNNVVRTGGARNVNRNGDLIVVVNDNNHFGGGLRGGLGGIGGGLGSIGGIGGGIGAIGGGLGAIGGGLGAIGGGLGAGVMVGGLGGGMGGMGIGGGNMGLGRMGLGAGFRGDVDMGDSDRRPGNGNMGRLSRELGGSYNINDADTVVIGGRA
ncbi:hypothetical protein ElyMa_000217700 [Elysia marginata]|uniref:Uncharacterized protein n=1 Tax=Elysia marginata TaxID=1093978 RepID=A0AAV4EYB8_9GAST|nr:hypothetical protein ElyMa_000217700 [Elysia marginata]